MIADVLNARIREYAPASAVEQENVLQELMQHYVLASLSRAGMFSDAIFHGGTCLRIIHGMSRFSEDLHFLLKRPDPGFRWQKLLEAVERDCAREGIEFELQDKSAADNVVRKAFLKTDSIGKVLLLALPFDRPNPRKIRIKLEIDTNPPAGSAIQTSYITFPGVAAITTQTLPSGFGTKAHALLCRKYVKGRDWYDFVWYTSRRVAPDLGLLGNALFQQGPWAGRSLEMTPDWLFKNLGAAIRRIDWRAAGSDVRRFVPTVEQPGLDVWSTDFFLYQLEQLRGVMRGK
jgi:predicted nucleotidyltransferase component of viral defense system